MIGVDKTREELERIEQQARETQNALALEAIEMVQTVLMARHALMMHIEKERDLRLRYHAALSKALHWCVPAKIINRKKPTNEDLKGLLSNVQAEIRIGLGETADFEASA